jgi:hypothetical protein
LWYHLRSRSSVELPATIFDVCAIAEPLHELAQSRILKYPHGVLTLQRFLRLEVVPTRLDSTVDTQDKHSLVCRDRLGDRTYWQ